MTASVDKLINLVGQAIIDPLFLLFFSLALLIFVWGAFVYVLKADDVEERRQSDVFWDYRNGHNVYRSWNYKFVKRDNRGFCCQVKRDVLNFCRKKRPQDFSCGLVVCLLLCERRR